MKTKSILIVDDEAHIAAVVALKLERAGLKVTIARDGREALRLTKEQHFDLVIADLHMPRMGGLALCRALRSEKDTSDIPVMVITGLGHTIDAGALEDTNVLAVVAKPFSPMDLQERVVALLQAA